MGRGGLGGRRGRRVMVSTKSCVQGRVADERRVDAGFGAAAADMTLLGRGELRQAGKWPRVCGEMTDRAGAPAASSVAG